MNKIIYPCDVPFEDGKKYPMFCKIEFNNDELSISGVIGPNKGGNCKGSCGQIEMGFDHENKNENDNRCDIPITAGDLYFTDGWNAEMWYKFLHVWHKYHLNDMHAECVHQEEKGITYESDKNNICDVCGYKIGSRWTMRLIPADVIEFLFDLPESSQEPSWG
jgi:hypothetical protein